MKKIITFLTTIILSMSFTLTVTAQSNCVISAKDVAIQQKGQVTVPIEISSNNGFTNFGIALDYDREKLELVSINTKDGETAYLCGEFAAVNTEWTDEDEKTYGYITVASDSEITNNGVLFTATFNTTDSFNENATVTPIVKYMRNNTAVFSVFENINATADLGVITLKTDGTTSEVKLGDFDGDGFVTMLDVSDAFNAYMNEDELTDTQKIAADFNDNGIIDMLEVSDVFDIYMNE